MKSYKLFATLIALILLGCQTQKNERKVGTPDEKLSASIQKIAELKASGYEIVDYHAHLKGGLTMEELLAHSKETGIDYGIAFNAGLGFPITDDKTLLENYEKYKDYPVYMAMQAEGREWVDMFSKENIATFDYVFTDAMTWTDRKGRRMRLWMPEEVFVDDKDDFMDQLVEKIVGVMEDEPIDLYVNSTFLPDVLQDEYEQLWTSERMDRVIAASVKNQVAIEINARYKIPSARFIKRAKAAGVKFSMGTNNTDKNLGTLDYAIEMIEECGLEPDDFFKPVKEKIVKGIYGNPAPFWEKEMSLTELGINAIFVHGGSIDSVMIDRARNEGLKVFAEFPTLNGKGYVNQHPEAWAIDDLGRKVEAASWFMGVCPTNPGFREFRLDQLRTMLSKYDLDGIWMDYVHWHAQFEDPNPILPETCFCDHCLSEFSSQIKIELPYGATAEKAKWILENADQQWRDWRCQVIFDWTSDFRTVVKDLKPNALLGLYHCPWDDAEFDGARRRVLGLDYGLLSKTIDVFSPMVYHERMGRSPQWVAENISWFSEKLQNDKAQVWPIVQAHDDPGIVSEKDFETVLRGGLSGKSSGIMMFTSYSVAEEPYKIEVMKRVYRSKP